MRDTAKPVGGSRLMSPEEIAVGGGPQVPYVHLQGRASVFADRETRLRERSASHAMRDFLLFMAELARAQHETLQHYRAVPLPDGAALDTAALAGKPPLPALLWPRDAAWQAGFRDIVERLLPRLAGSPAEAAVQALQDIDSDRLEQQADRLLNGVMLGLDMAAAPLVAAGLQTYWTHMSLALRESRAAGSPDAFGRTDDPRLCPCCGSRPTASVSRIGADSGGLRYLHCSLCSTQWHMVRIKCTNCLSTKGIHYQSAQKADATPNRDGRASGRQEAVEAETCDECGHYLKIVHMERDAYVEPVADDLATVTLDLLVSEAGFQRHGVNLMLLFGDPDPDAAGDSGPDPGGH